MLRFIVGFVVGALAASWYQQNQAELDVDRRFAEMQDRANAVLNESRRILEETRRELVSAMESGRHSLQAKSERLRHVAETGEAQPGGETPTAS